MILLFKLLFVPLLLPFVSSFQLTANSKVTVGVAAQVQWIRHDNDPSSFSLLLRRDDQDRGGTLIRTILSTGDSQGTETFTAVEQTNFLIQIISDLQPLRDDQQPQRILASSNKISAVQDSNPPQPASQTTSSSSSTSSRTTAQTTATPTLIATDRGGSNGDRTGTTESTTSGGGGIRAETTSSSVPSSTVTFGGVAANQTQAAQTPEPKAAGLKTPLTSSAGISPTDSNTSSPPPSVTSTGQPPLSGASSKKANVGVIVGSVLAGLIFLFLVIFLLFIYNRRKRRRQTLEYAFRRDLMAGQSASKGTISFHSVSPSAFNTPGPSAHAPKMSEVSSGGYTTYQKYWENQPMSDNNRKIQNEDANNPPVHGSIPSTSTSTFTYTSSLSSSPSVFYTAVPKPVQQGQQQPELAPGFTFPVRDMNSSSADTPTPTVTTASASASASAATPTKTDRQIAIQNKMNQLRTQLVVLQSRNARGSGFTEDSKSTTEEGASEREEIGRIREELERLGEIMNSGWAMRRTESGGDVPAGLKM